MKVDEYVLHEICKACGREEDPIFRHQTSLLFFVVDKPIDLVQVLITEYSSMQKKEIVQKLIEFKDNYLT